MNPLDPEEQALIETYDEQKRAELEELFRPFRTAYGEAFKDQLSVNEELRDITREMLEEGRISGKFPIVADIFFDLTPEEQEIFFKTGGEILLKHLPTQALIEDSFRLKRLRWLLKGQFEFETRYPAAYELLWPDRARATERVGLYLPSFDVRVLSNNPIVHSEIRQQPCDEVDCYSSTHDRTVDTSQIRREVWPVRMQDLKGILLQVLSREEYNDRIDPVLPEEAQEHFKGLRVPHLSLIRITDLRTAQVLDHVKLKDGLISLLESLERPVTSEGVVRWKRKLLEQGSEIHKAYVQDPQSGDLEAGKGITDALTVSFAAAALLLFVDLDMPRLRNASSYRLAEQIESLARIIGSLMEALETATEKLDTLAANLSAGRQPDLRGKDYWSLRRYRMGKNLEQLAEARGITPYDSARVQGTRDWKAKLKQAFVRGRVVEDEEYPRASAIFANEDNPHVREKARRAYRFYVENGDDFEGNLDHTALARQIYVGGIHKRRGQEIADAYVQLGSCIEQGISPLP